jgi:hypothetical protein
MEKGAGRCWFYILKHGSPFQNINFFSGYGTRVINNFHRVELVTYVKYVRLEVFMAAFSHSGTSQSASVASYCLRCS